MKPNFALSLSLEGISLLHRTDRGWYLVGEVLPDAADMAAELATLRKTAKALDNRGLRTRLILPNDRIRYLTVETGKVDDASRIQGAQAALDGATPYAVSELAISASAEGRLTHVAAVAHETLQEAEAFATEHRFNPMCFVASPAEGDYLGEPFFGLTNFAAALPDAGAGLGPAAKPVRISANSRAPAPEQNPATETAEPPAKPVPDSGPQSATDPIAPAADTAIQTGSNIAEAAAPQNTKAKTPVTARDVTPAATPVPSFHSTRTTSETGTATPDSAPALKSASRLTISPASDAEQTVAAPAARKLRPEKPAEAKLPDPETQSDRKGDQAKQIATASLSKAASTLGSLRAALPSKRNPGTPPADAAATTTAPVQAATSDASASQPVGGKPRYLGLILTLVLLGFLVAVAVWASVFTDDGLAGLFDDRDDKPAVIASVPPLTDLAPPVQQTAPATIDTPAPDQITDSSDVENQTTASAATELSQRDAEAHYAVTGIWLKAPAAPRQPQTNTNDDLYIASIDRLISAQDAVAIPNADLALSDIQPHSLSAPAAAGTTFAFDARGLVIATRQGAISPDGVTIYQGRPEVTPSSFPTRADDQSQIEQFTARLATLRPRARPGDLLENTERARNGGLTLRQLARLRPKARPATAKFELEKNQSATKQAIAVSHKPKARPKGFDAIVQTARAQQQDSDNSSSITKVAAAAPAIDSGPRIPTTASVARQATVKNAINLRKVNLIGVYGKAASRRALVRLANGRYKKVKVGDRIDGGKVSAIGETELRYVKSGRNLVLKMPKT